MVIQRKGWHRRRVGLAARPSPESCLPSPSLPVSGLGRMHVGLAATQALHYRNVPIAAGHMQHGEAVVRPRVVGLKPLRRRALRRCSTVDGFPHAGRRLFGVFFIPRTAL